ncbi:uncharacterized protein LOC130894130 [Diorhabda carinulata]|uniref:uncharacterized protein LOC130894130 n=1 Tax=Diorhabda carinulata TaxID=1163345 RepID=UPI0025A18D67|nr:uncharacterized protein LOC130894130 [Diorhabda carinulata]
MAVSVAKIIGAGILIISEPNLNFIRNRKDWVIGDDLTTAIKVNNCDISIKSQGYGAGFTYVTITDDITIYSCYMSGNDEDQTLEETLNAIGRLVREKNQKAVIGGDFNAKSPQWGMSYSDRRRHIVTEWIATNDFTVLNKGEAPTFERRGYGSILDLTLATGNVSSCIANWKVLDEESLSDHNYISFDIKETMRMPAKPRSDRGWKVNNLDIQHLKRVISEEERFKSMASASDLSENLKVVCNKVLQKKKHSSQKPPAYWWNQEIAELRRQCMRKRRLYTRNRRRNSPEENEVLWTEYQESKKLLKRIIKQSKRKCWKELCERVDSDIWGDGYKIAMRGISGFPSRLSLTMDTIEQVVKHLFPVHQDVIFNCDNNNRILSFSVSELQVASRKLKSGKAPGPGNIPPEVLKAAIEANPDRFLTVYNTLANSALCRLPRKMERSETGTAT